MARKTITLLCVFSLALSLLTGGAWAEGETAGTDPVKAAEETASGERDLVLVGLAYGSEARPGANLANHVGNGFQFGYLDGERNFHPVAETEVSGISVVKTQNVWYGIDPQYSTTLRNYSDNITSEISVGCWHILVGRDYESYEAAADAAGALGGFVAWIDGAYQVRVGAYANREEAENGLLSLPEGVAEPALVGTSAYGVSVVKTGTGQILFQFDGVKEDLPLTVFPRAEAGEKPITWYNNTRWYGGFQYRRVNGENLTVINAVEMDDYITCLLSQEMSPSWPIEALKAQAVCARTYVETTRAAKKHFKHGFDVCNTMECQAYPGYGNQTERTDQATAETAGLRGWYQGKPAEMYYFSSSGGGTENVKNVWGSSIPYLCGVVDPYEETVKDKIAYWSVTKTMTLTELDEAVRPYIQRKGYNCAEITDVRITELTPTGNVKSIVFTDKNGKEWPFTQATATTIARTVLGLRSIRYTVDKQSPAGTGVYYTDGGGTLSSMNGVYAINADGTVSQLSGRVYIISAGGTEPLPQPETAASEQITFVFHTSGWGHSIGMSQWGAYAMALQGKTFEEILTFYYPGIEIY